MKVRLRAQTMKITFAHGIVDKYSSVSTTGGRVSFGNASDDVAGK